MLEGSTAIRVRNTLVHTPLLGAVIRALLAIAKGLVPRRAVRDR